MSKTYANLKELIKGDAAAEGYFSRLPQYVREQLADRSSEINSMDSLISHVQNFTKGDD